MKKENILVIALVVVALGSVYLYNAMKTPDRFSDPSPAALSGDAASLASGEGGISWKDYTPGMATARDAGKSIFLYFHAPWCTYCTKLKMTTFKDDKVIAYLNENFVSIEVDTDQNRALAGKWKVTGLPTIFFLDHEGSTIQKIPGYVAPGQMLQFLKFIHTKSYTTMEFHEFVKQS